MGRSIETYAELLSDRGISLETAKRAGVYAVDTNEATNLGFCGNGYTSSNLSGLALPYRHPLTLPVTQTRLRPDVPVMVHGQSRKYLAPAGSRNCLYFPLALPEHLSDPRFDCIVTQGELKYLSLIDAIKTKYFVLASAGVWNWRTSDREKRPNRDNGGMHTVKTNSRPVEDLDGIVWKGAGLHHL